MNILRKIFGGKTEDSQYDLSQLGLPREGDSLEEDLENQRRRVKSQQSGLGSVTMYLNLQDIARRQDVNSPFITALEGRAQVILRLEGLSNSETQQMQSAVKEGRVLLIPVLAKCPTCPVLGLRFCIYDVPTNPFVAEASRDIKTANVQEFVSAVLKDGGGEFNLYEGVNAEQVASGTFLLRMPPFEGVGFPYKTTASDLKVFWKLLNEAAKHLREIPVASRDFQAAVNYYFEHTSLG
jgi:hypothetical protein